VTGPPPEKPIGDVLEVAAVTYAPENTGRVVIKYRDESLRPKPDETVLGIGAMLVPPYDEAPFHARLKSITPLAAVFDWCGKDIELRPNQKGEGKRAATAAGPANPLDDGDKAALDKHRDSKLTLNLGNDRYLVGKDDRANYEKNGERLLNEVRIQEQPTADKKGKEVVLGNVRPTSQLSRTYGVQTGDVLISINGEPVSSKTQAIRYVRENSDLEKYVVVLRRKGKEVTKTILVPRDR
jgi:hypothetical protein